MMYTTSLPRIGRHGLKRPLNRPLIRRRNRCLDFFVIHLAAGRRPPPVNWLREKSCKRFPEEHPVEAWRRYQREREQAALQAELNAALNKVYGLSSPAIVIAGTEMVRKRSN